MIQIVADRLIFTAMLVLLLLVTIADGSRNFISTSLLSISIQGMIIVYVLFCYKFSHCQIVLTRYKLIWVSLLSWLAITVYQSLGIFGYESFEPFASYRELILYFDYVAFLFLATALLSNTTRIAIVVTVLLVIAVAQTGFGLMNYLNGTTIYGWQQSFYTGLNLTGTFVNRNFYANFMVMCLGFSMIPILMGRNKDSMRSASGIYKINYWLWKLVLFAISAWLLYGILLSGSRGGLVSAGLAGAIIVIVSCVSRSVRIHLLPIFLSVITLILLIDFESMTSRFWTIFSDSNARVEQWIASLQVVLEKPLLGFGPGSYEAAYKTGIPISAPSLTHNHAHNEYIELLLEQGVIGVLALFAFIVLVLKSGLPRVMKTRSHRRAVTMLSALFGMCAMLIHAMFDFPFQVPSNTLLFLVITAIFLSTPLLSYKKRISN